MVKRAEQTRAQRKANKTLRESRRVAERSRRQNAASSKRYKPNGWQKFLRKDFRIRGTILAVLLVAFSTWILFLALATNAQLNHDRALVRSQPSMEATVMDIGGKWGNPTVKLDDVSTELAHGLRGEFFVKIPEQILVVIDPTDPARIIPVELADVRGNWQPLIDQGPLIFLWLVGVTFLGGLIIPRELTEIGKKSSGFLGKEVS